jgi:hypothetical protein
VTPPVDYTPDDIDGARHILRDVITSAAVRAGLDRDDALDSFDAGWPAEPITEGELRALWGDR